MGTLEGRVALITGAGRGIGREEALFFAKEGAKVVVNDPGVEIDGTGGDGAVAHSVVEEIVAAGGQAVANLDDVTDWHGAERMVATAVETFGDLHVVVNNAGIERVRSLVATSEEEFDAVIAVHLKGSFAVSRFAARHWREQYDLGARVDRSLVNTASGSGLLNPLPLHTSYAAAKAGIAAMTTVHALELGGYGVRVNCLSPSMARTRLTMEVPGMSERPAPGAFDPFHPAASAPVAAYLAAAGCPLTGQVLTVRGGDVMVNKGWSPGPRVAKEGLWTVGELAAELERLPYDDPFDRLAQALGGALGGEGRERIRAMIDAALAEHG
ncbi:SDR family NAD(P)-dependent oxidoreductase [Nonomuraea dietziae]|uniref:NAD(P)-dependent dehydrogenase (Short-subunit alcohol dehydrogenase family) n=1 Tax=Nonomuraea dietziae TaxID=65515 RepID=A0A7W5Y683_9ACTN|nr:SDR family NAD(P)-dependent oxidoreductase [Nonomuraea dietziae]MBB3726216.1 NAD(P)-dependent dehydrogenase (short-subunit alcohol dehydrogenase family) [Nonomuraea dietziae]